MLVVIAALACPSDALSVAMHTAPRAPPRQLNVGALAAEPLPQSLR